MCHFGGSRLQRIARNHAILVCNRLLLHSSLFFSWLGNSEARVKSSRSCAAFQAFISSHRGRDRSLRFFQSQGWESLRRIPTVSFYVSLPPYPLKVEEKTTNSNWLCSARIRHLVVDALSASSCLPRGDRCSGCWECNQERDRACQRSSFQKRKGRHDRMFHYSDTRARARERTDHQHAMPPYSSLDQRVDHSIGAWERESAIEDDIAHLAMYNS